MNPALCVDSYLSIQLQNKMLLLVQQFSISMRLAFFFSMIFQFGGVYRNACRHVHIISLYRYVSNVSVSPNHTS